MSVYVMISVKKKNLRVVSFKCNVNGHLKVILLLITEYFLFLIKN